MIKILPSIMAKNQKEMNKLFSKLRGISKTFHLDVVDGKFAKNKSLNFDFKLPKGNKYHAHLMIKNPERWILKNGDKVDLCIIHASEVKDFEKYVLMVNKVAVALKPGDKVNKIKKYLPLIDYVLVLTVKPGFYGSKYLPKCLEKIKIIKKLNPKIKVIVDGHMDPSTVENAVKAGADIIISGSFITKAENSKEAITILKKVAI